MLALLRGLKDRIYSTIIVSKCYSTYSYPSRTESKSYIVNFLNTITLIAAAPNCTQEFREVLEHLINLDKSAYRRCTSFFSLCVAKTRLERGNERIFVTFRVTKLAALRWCVNSKELEALQVYTGRSDLADYFLF